MKTKRVEVFMKDGIKDGDECILPNGQYNPVFRSIENYPIPVVFLDGARQRIEITEPIIEQLKLTFFRDIQVEPIEVDVTVTANVWCGLSLSGLSATDAYSLLAAVHDGGKRFKLTEIIE